MLSCALAIFAGSLAFGEDSKKDREIGVSTDAVPATLGDSSNPRVLPVIEIGREKHGASLDLGSVLASRKYVLRLPVKNVHGQVLVGDTARVGDAGVLRSCFAGRWRWRYWCSNRPGESAVEVAWEYLCVCDGNSCKVRKHGRQKVDSTRCISSLFLLFKQELHCKRVSSSHGRGPRLRESRLGAAYAAILRI